MNGVLQRIFENVVLLSDHMTDFDLGRGKAVCFIQFVSRKERKKERNRKKRVLGMLKIQFELVHSLLLFAALKIEAAAAAVAARHGAATLAPARHVVKQ